MARPNPIPIRCLNFIYIDGYNKTTKIKNKIIVDFIIYKWYFNYHTGNIYFIYNINSGNNQRQKINKGLQADNR